MMPDCPCMTANCVVSCAREGFPVAMAVSCGQALAYPGVAWVPIVYFYYSGCQPHRGFFVKT